jgi:hypothetical protein
MRSNYQRHVGGGIAKEEHVSFKIMDGGVIIMHSEHISLGFSVHLPYSVNYHIKIMNLRSLAL